MLKERGPSAETKNLVSTAVQRVADYDDYPTNISREALILMPLLFANIFGRGDVAALPEGIRKLRKTAESIHSKDTSNEFSYLLMKPADEWDELKAALPFLEKGSEYMLRANG